MEILKYLKWKKPMMTGMLIALSLVLGLSGMVEARGIVKQIVLPTSIKVLDSTGAEVTATTELGFGTMVTVVCNGLKPNTNYTVQRGVTTSSTGINLLVGTNLFDPTFPADSGYDVYTDANGYFAVSYMVGEIAGDASAELRTLSIHEGTGVSPGAAVLTAVTFKIKPVISLSRLTAAAYGQNDSYGSPITWKELGFTSSSGKVNETSTLITGASQTPYLLTVHGFSGQSGYKSITLSQGGKDVPLWDGAARVTTVPLNENGTLTGTVYTAIPEIPAGAYPISAIDGKGVVGTIPFTVIPTLLKGDTDNPNQDVEILVRQNGPELKLKQGDIQIMSGIGFPPGTIGANTIKVGDKASTHTAIVVPNSGVFSNQSITVADDATPGVNNIIIGGSTFSNVVVIGPTIPKAPKLTSSKDTTFTGDPLSAALTNVGSDGASDPVLYTFYDADGLNQLVPADIDSTKDATGDDDNVIFQLAIPDLANTYTVEGVLQTIIFRAGSDENADGDIDDQVTATDKAEKNLTVEPKVWTGWDYNNNGNLDQGTAEIFSYFTNGQLMAVDISGFVFGDTVQVAIEGIPHAVLNADTAVGVYAELEYGVVEPATDSGFSIRSNGTTGENNFDAKPEVMLIRIGDTNGDGDIEEYLAGGEHIVTVTGSTYGSVASNTITIYNPTASLQQTSSLLYTYAPVNNTFNGIEPTTDTANEDVIPGGTGKLSILEPTGENFKASTPYLILFDNQNDTVNLQKAGSFISSIDGRIPLNTVFTVPFTALPGYHNVLIAEDLNANGTYDNDPIVIGPGFIEVYVDANVSLNHYIRHVGDSLTVTLWGLNPGNETDPKQAKVYQILVDSNDNDAMETADPVYPIEGFTPDNDGKATVDFTIPDIPGGNINLYVVEKGTLARTEPYTYVNWEDIGPDAQIHIAPIITLDKYVGDKGDTVCISGKGFDPGNPYVVTFGFVNDKDVEQRGQVVTSFIATSEGQIPADICFTVPMANNAGYGVVVTPTPAANYVDVAIDDGNGLSSALLAGDQKIFTVGGVIVEFTSVTADCPNKSVVAHFSGALNEGTAETIAHYTITEKDSPAVSVAVTAAVYDSTAHTVTLTTGTLAEGTTYTLKVDNLIDTANNAVSGSQDFSCVIVPPVCTEWSDVIAKYNEYVADTATWDDVIACYNVYVGQ